MNRETMSRRPELRTHRGISSSLHQATKAGKGWVDPDLALQAEGCFFPGHSYRSQLPLDHLRRREVSVFELLEQVVPQPCPLTELLHQQDDRVPVSDGAIKVSIDLNFTIGIRSQRTCTRWFEGINWGRSWTLLEPTRK